MIVFLTSSPGGYHLENGERIPAGLNSANGFVDNLKQHWVPNARCLIISSDPDAAAINDGMQHIFQQAFSITGLSVSEVSICDRRNAQCIANHIKDFDVVLLSGGHVPTQNAFFQEIQLKERLSAFDGILIGISAGTMNSAAVVYAHPELEGESVDPHYQRFLPGLGITELMVLPHYQSIKADLLDGKRVMEDIAYPDSIGRKFYALVDGSYIMISNGKQELYGEAYLIADGAIHSLCDKDESIVIG